MRRTRCRGLPERREIRESFTGRRPRTKVMGPEQQVIKCHSTCRRLGDAPGKDTGETNGEEKAKAPVPAPDAGKAPLPGKKINLAAGDAEGSEDEARAGNGNGALSGQGKESTRSGHGDQGDGGSNGGEDRNRPPNWL